MALSALHAHAKKQLRDIFKLVLRILDPFVPSHWRIRENRSGCGQEFSNHLVVRLIRQKAVADPGVKREIRRDIARIISAILEHCRPFVGKEVRILSACEQLLDRIIALAGRSVREETC